MAEAKKAAKTATKKTTTTKATKPATAKKAVPKKSAEKPKKEVKATKKIEEIKDGPTKEVSNAKGETSQEPEVNTQKLEDGNQNTEKTTAKAGKRSAKAIAEGEAKQAKEERKAEAKSEKTDDKPKIQQKPARSKLERKSKNFRKVAELIEKGKSYNLAQATELASKTSPVKFDATVEMHVRLGVDPKQADQNIRDTIVLPAGTGKTVRIAVFTDADGIAAAKKAGADIAAADEFLQQLEKGTIDFDILISTPANMPKLGKYARLLGPKGLMPNPKSGTVTIDIVKAVSEAKAGRVEYRVDSTGIVHLGIGKVSFGEQKLAENARTVLASIKANKPSGVKGTYIQSIYLTTSMGPSISVELSEAN